MVATAAWLVAGSSLASSSDHGTELWAGQWTTNTGGVAWRAFNEQDLNTAKTGKDAKELFNKLPCKDGPEFYRGGYTSGGDRGKIMGCGTPTSMRGRWLSNVGGNYVNGSYEIHISSRNPLKFTGKYRQDNGATGTYSGTWASHFDGDGCCEEPACRKPASVGGGTAACLTLTYEMPERFGPDANGDQLIDYVTTAAQVAPKNWRVEFTVSKNGKPCDPKASYTWTVDSKAASFTKTGACTFFHEFPREAKFAVEVTAGSDLGSAEVVVQDWLIVGLGDSNGSGEGNPDVEAGMFAQAKWEDVRCDRSALSFEAKTALAIERADKKTGVTFVHLACSGASMPNGLTGTYRGINDPGGAAIQPQLSEMGTLVGKREIDAVLLSVGVNDIGFGPMVVFCLDNDDCQNRNFPTPTSPKKLKQVMAERLAALPALYKDLGDRFRKINIPANRIYISQYFDSTRDKQGKTCDPLITTVQWSKGELGAAKTDPKTGKVITPAQKTGVAKPSGGVQRFSKREAIFASQDVLEPLNLAVARAAKSNRWQLISGAAQSFHTHGYCSTEPWIVGVSESLSNQHDAFGTLHANKFGHDNVAGLALAELKPDLFPRGKPRPPK